METTNIEEKIRAQFNYLKNTVSPVLSMLLHPPEMHQTTPGCSGFKIMTFRPHHGITVEELCVNDRSFNVEGIDQKKLHGKWQNKLDSLVKNGIVSKENVDGVDYYFLADNQETFARKFFKIKNECLYGTEN